MPSVESLKAFAPLPKMTRGLLTVRTAKEVGKILGISQQAVNIIEKRAMQKLRAKLSEITQGDIQQWLLEI